MRVLKSSPCVPALLILISSFGWTGCKKKAAPAPPPEVEVMTVEAKDTPIYEEWIGTLDGYVNARIRAQVTGYILTQNYKEGTPVKKGALLFQIDPRPFQAVLDQTKARLTQDQAQAGKTQLDVKRYTPLAKEQAVSQEVLDDAVQADLGSQAQLKADEAAEETAELNLGFTKITSPVDGIAGFALIQVGDLVSPGGAVLTSVSTIDPIKVYFNVSEQSYLTFWQKYVNPPAGESAPALNLQLILSDGSVYNKPGKFFIADRQVNSNTGTLQIAGLFPNPDFFLRPGQYGLVRAETQLQKGAIVVPQRAVNELQGSYQVYVVDDQKKSHIRPVKVGPQIGGNWIIEDGLKSGEQVIVEGLQKAAKEGTVVNPQPFKAPVETNASVTMPPTNP